MKIELLNKNIDFFERKEFKYKLLKLWISKHHVFSTLKNHKVDFKIFIKDYALNTINYLINIVKEDNIFLENDKEEELINFLKEHDISIVEIFIIYNGLKEAIIDCFHDLDFLDYGFIKEINYIYEKTFSNVLSNYNQINTKIEKKLSKREELIDKYIIMSKYDNDGNIIDVSSAFCEISGYSKDELIGQSFKKIKHPDFDDTKIDEIEKTIKSGQIWHGEVKNKSKEGKTYWVEATISPVFDESGEILYYDSIRQDITNRKVLEEQQSILIEQSKSAAIGEMISMIAHQWRQPLQAVSILIQKLSLSKMQGEEITDELLNPVVDNITSQLEYMSKTIDDFRDFFMPDKPKEKISIKDLIDKTIDFLNFMLKNDGINVEIEIKDNIELNVYINELIQVFINIIKNARDILVEKNIENSHIKIKSFVEDSFIYVTIEDNAGGIPEDVIKKVFEPYFSTKDDKNGTGLGLYMCKTIIEKQSLGSLSVENIENGAKFIIKLPIS